MAITPPPVGAVLEASHAKPDAPADPVIAMVAFCAFVNVTGLPGISLPVHWTDDGVPVGAQPAGGPGARATRGPGGPARQIGHGSSVRHRAAVTSRNGATTAPVGDHAAEAGRKGRRKLPG